jgi:TetR/AcrR family transcriptional repressor of bet genes
MAIALDALLEGLWLRLMMGNSGISRETAKASAIGFLKTAFPKDYPQ